MAAPSLLLCGPARGKTGTPLRTRVCCLCLRGAGHGAVTALLSTQTIRRPFSLSVSATGSGLGVALSQAPPPPSLEVWVRRQLPGHTQEWTEGWSRAVRSMFCHFMRSDLTAGSAFPRVQAGSTVSTEPSPALPWCRQQPLLGIFQKRTERAVRGPRWAAHHIPPPRLSSQPLLPSHPDHPPLFLEIGVLQGLVGSDSLVRIIGHHCVQEGEALRGQIGCLKRYS